MKAIAVAIAVVAGLVGTPAFAADMAVKAPPVPAAPAAPSWDGFYIGGDAGYGIGITNFNQPFQGDFLATHGFAGGLLGGYNYVFAPRWLAGAEADVTWGSIAHRENMNDGFGDVGEVNIAEREAGSVRGRFGYLLEPKTLLYVTGGWSWARFSYSFITNVDGSEASNVTVNGPEVGFGVETMLGAGWSARLEYLEAFYDYGSFASPVLGSVFGASASSIVEKPAVGTGQFALIYRFGAGDPAPSTATLLSPAPSTPSSSSAPSWNGPTLAATVAAVSATARLDSSVAPGNEIDGIGASAVLPTALAGYNWHIAPRWVFGVDGGGAPGLATTKVHLDWTEAAHARIGYLLTPMTMAYASVGWFGTGFKTTNLVANDVLVPQQRTNALEIGGGVETALNAHWAARFEYQYGFMQTIHDVMVTITGTGNPPSVQLPVDVHPQVQSAQAGVVYYFDVP